MTTGGYLTHGWVLPMNPHDREALLLAYLDARVENRSLRPYELERALR